jgi:hypothetical protein
MAGYRPPSVAWKAQIHMKETRVFIPQRRYIACPACGKGEHLIEHLIIPHQVQKWGDWVCKE